MFKNSVRYGLLVLITAIFIFPFAWILVSSFKPQREIFRMPPTLLPAEPTLQNYGQALGLNEDPEYGPTDIPYTFRNSVIIAFLSTGAIISVAVPAAYAFAKIDFPFRTPILISLLSLRMLPGIVLVLPIFVLFQTLKLLDTYPALVITYSALNLPFAIWLLSVFFQEVPSEIEDAATVDGCGRLGALRYIVLPLAAPAVTAIGILVFLNCWNEFLFALILTSTPTAKTIPLGLASLQSAYFTRWGVMTAGAVLQTLPAIAFVLFAQKYIISGLTLGGVKE
jgi:ABC-type glycerol-3-phosphate transport system permease component